MRYSPAFAFDSAFALFAKVRYLSVLLMLFQMSIKDSRLSHGQKYGFWFNFIIIISNMWKFSPLTCPRREIYNLLNGGGCIPRQRHRRTESGNNNIIILIIEYHILWPSYNLISHPFLLITTSMHATIDLIIIITNYNCELRSKTKHLKSLWQTK